MYPALFLQSDVEDPYAIYNDRLSAQPVFWDEQNKLWAVYSYQGCKEVFLHPGVRIPPVMMDGLNEYARAITHRLVRLSNAPLHKAAKQAALLLSQHMQQVSVRDIMRGLLPAHGTEIEIDWVNSIGRTLPVLHILHGFGMNGEEGGFIADSMDALLTIMQPVKTAAQVNNINTKARDIYTTLEKQLLHTGFIKEVIHTLVSTQAVSAEEALALCVSNLAGLLIQSYDAGRGILSNALLQWLRHATPGVLHNDDIPASVIETFRFDPPVHNTRRIAAGDISINGYTIESGQTILLVMAAANRDPHQFHQPGEFNTARPNNNEHLTFGLGAHMCVAKAFSARMATDALSFLFEHYATIRLAGGPIAYEPLVNLRLPRHVFITCSK